jgi:hypothetical protein
MKNSNRYQKYDKLRKHRLIILVYRIENKNKKESKVGKKE